MPASPSHVSKSVIRQGLSKEFTGDRPIKTQFSNSNIENYLLTQIEDEIKSSNAEKIAQDASQETAATNGSIDYFKSAPGKYINKNKVTEYLELKPDGTFFLHERGKGFAGKYEVSGDEITLVVSNRMATKGKLRGNTLIDDAGQDWVKSADSLTTSITP